MEIVIGATPRVRNPLKRTPTASGTFVEAKMLNVRPPRRRNGNAPGRDDRRIDKGSVDPVGGRVMTLMIPDGYTIPSDIQNGSYRIFLRFVPHRR